MLSVGEDFAGIAPINCLTSSTVGHCRSSRGSPLKAPSAFRASKALPANLVAMAALMEMFFDEEACKYITAHLTTRDDVDRFGGVKQLSDGGPSSSQVGSSGLNYPVCIMLTSQGKDCFIRMTTSPPIFRTIMLTSTRLPQSFQSSSFTFCRNRIWKMTNGYPGETTRRLVKCAFEWGSARRVFRSPLCQSARRIHSLFSAGAVNSLEFARSSWKRAISIDLKLRKL